MNHSHLHHGPLDPHLLDEPVASGHGGEVIFLGRVRDVHQGRAVRGIAYHAHTALAETRLAEIEAETARRFGVACRVAHAVGELGVGDISVIVRVDGGHRPECFAAARWAIDTIKASVPIWKEERYADGSAEFLDGQPLRDVS